MLLEPTTVVAKAWELVAVMRARAFWEPRQVLVTGAGPIGMLAALIGVQHGLDVHVLDRVTEGAKPQLVHDVGATYHSGAIADIGFDPDVIIECTGVGSVIIDSIRHVGAGGVVCLTGVGSGGQASGLSTRRRGQGAGPGRTTWSSARSTPTGGTSTGRPRRSPPPTGPGSARLISRRVPPQNIADALKRSPDDIKVVVDFGG